MMKVVLLNGPVNSGKNYLAEHLIKRLGGVEQQFKAALYTHTAELFQVDLRWFIQVASDRILKEQAMEDLQGFSPRQALIVTSEKVYKLIYGEDYFGKATAERLERGLNFVSDSGFLSESEVLVDKVGAENCYLVRIHRDGTGFDPEKDSRSYINLDHLGVRTLDLDNNRDIEEVINDIVTEFNL